MTRTEILSLIPHAGEMCLLDELLSWDEENITCRSNRFTTAANPLRRTNDMLGTATAIEAAAQAMALHARLTAPQQGAPCPGLLAALRDVHLTTATLSSTGPLTLHATRLVGDDTGASYGFTVRDNHTIHLTGRATVLFGTAS